MDQVVRVSKRCNRATVWSRNIFQRLRNICIFNAKMHNFSPFSFFFLVIFVFFWGCFALFCLRKIFRHKFWLRTKIDF